MKKTELSREEICALLLKISQNQEAILSRLERIEGIQKEGRGSRQRRGSLEQVRGYAVELGLSPAAGEHFFDRMETVDWVRGKNQQPIKDWRAMMRTWKTNNWLELPGSETMIMGGM